MPDIYFKGSMREITPAERAASNKRILKHMEKKFIKDRTPAKFKKRAIALAGNMAQAATEMGTEDQTFRRWCRGDSTIPGVAWVALESLEALKKLEC